jgi:uncharacterized protein YcbX
MRVRTLYRYPVKSLGGASVSELTPSLRGFVDDRRWMLIDERGRFISQRSLPGLARFRARLDGVDTLVFETVNGEVLGEVAGARPSGEGNVTVTVWDDTFPARLVEHPDIPAIARKLGLPGARLVYMNEEVRRPVDERYAKVGEEVSFADGYPYLITTTASLDDLSEKAEEALDERRFRPNIIVETETPFEEDHWRQLNIGNHHFRVPKPCARCIMVTHEPDTGDRNPRVLAELAAYRKEGPKILFGMNACWEGGEGDIRVGDMVVETSPATS